MQRLYTALLIISIICTNICYAAGTTSSEENIYIVSFKSTPLARHEKNNKNSFLLDQQAVKIAAEQQEFMSSLKHTFKKDYSTLFSYKNAINAISLKLTQQEVAFIKKQNNVLMISPQEYLYPATDASASMINADHLWSGQAIDPLPGVFGEDIIVGVIDTGINMSHESFSEIAEDNYDFSAHNPFGSDVFVGWCNPNHPNYNASYACNNKMIGAWDFVDSFGNETDGPNDSNFHGSSMSGIISGNKITAPMGGFDFSFNGGTLDAPYISGIAPHSHFIIYDVCDNIIGCPSSAILAAIEQAIIDGVDIINLALDGGNDPWNPNSVAMALLNANNQGIVTSSAAGNATAQQPNTLGRVNNLAPWLITAANSFHGRTTSNDVSILTPIPVPDFLLDIYALVANGITFAANVSVQVLLAENVDMNNSNGCLAWGAQVFDNSIALIPLGLCTPELKIQNAEDAGAQAVILFDENSHLPQTLTNINTPMIPAVMIGNADAQNIITHIQQSLPAPTIAQILAETQHKIVDALGMVLYHSSLRGPNEQFNISKPDISAPGTDIFAAIAELGQPAPQYFTATGTSQSAAVISGALALLKNVKPEWNPSQLKSAIMLTANANMTDEEGNDTTSDDIGSGMLDLAQAVNSILIMDETHQNYLQADPANGGKPENLNIASLRNNQCQIQCSWQRTFTNSSNNTYTWSIDSVTDQYSELSFSQNSFTLNADESITLDITFNSIVGQSDNYRFAEVVISDDAGQTPNAHLKVTVYMDDLIFRQGFE